MADNNLARNRNDGPDIFADDDPLAELARIVGYDERLVPKPPVAERREPAFNLEDELLQEFERYDSPRPHQSVVQPSAAAEPDMVPLVEEVATERAPAFEPAALEASQDDLEELEWSAVEQAFAEGFPQVEAGTATVEPLLDLGLPQGDVEPVSWNLDRGAAVETVSLEPVFADDFSEPAEYAAPSDEPVLDLADELELALGELDLEPLHQETGLHQEIGIRAEAPRPGIYTPGFRMPLANFNTKREALQPVAAPKAEPAFDVEPDLKAGDLAVEVTPDAASSQETVQPAASESNSADMSILDALINDVSRYPVPQPEPQPEIQNEAVLSAVAVDSWNAPRQQAAERFVEPTEARTVPAKAPEAVSKPADFSIDPLIDDEFELALDDLELDLSDIMSDDDLSVFAEPKPAAPAMAPIEPVRHTATWSPVARFNPSQAKSTAVGPAVPAMSIASATSYVQDLPATRAVPVTATPAPVAEPENLPDLPFDPALISENEEQPEPVVELDVPELHMEEQNQAPVYRNDYDIDIDAELASLLQSSAPASVADEIETAEQDLTPRHHVAQPAGPQTYPDLDDFERALEEDFRRSLTTPLPAQTDLGDAGARAGSRSFEGSRWSLSAMVVPLAVAGVVIAAGSIGYMIFGGDGTSVASNGEPVVIAADTDPVKVLPENPGGKTVPNQDKAVYDRVAGAAMEAPKQESLISTSEEPIDVVQKTLMTDTLPMEGEEFAGAADAEARDDRLLPQEDQVAGLALEQNQQSVAVTPRRVKTMIVRPDGTLVEQEVPATPAPVAAVTTPAQSDKLPAAPARTVEVASVPDAPAAGQPDTAGLVPVSTNGGSAQPTDLSATATPPTTGEASVGTPVPTARPDAQPATDMAAVTNQNNVQPAPVAPAAAPEVAAPATQVAAVPPGGYVIQIASLPSEADAQKSYQSLSSKFSSVIGGRGVDIKQAEIAGKGTFYRVRIPAGSKADAVELCEKYRVAGGSCLVAR